VTPTESKLPVEIFPSRKALAVAVVDRICALAAARQSERRPLVLGLAAGASPREVYRALSRHVRAARIDLARCVAFCLDEYYPITSQDPHSYASQMAGVAAELGIPMEALHIPSGDLPRSQVEGHCSQYEELIRLAGGIDLQLLGVGRSGHIGFNEPGTSRHSRTRLVQLDDRTRQDAAAAFGGVKHTPRAAITVGIATILEAKEVALIAIGRHKAPVVRRLVEERCSADVPASFLQEHDGATIYLDQDAASLLGKARVAAANCTGTT
jgi:glucosamine-6-phosphate deaminase